MEAPREKPLKKSDRTRQHLLETALNAFKTKEYEDCSLRELAREAGVTAPAFYYYFRSKEEIVADFYIQSLKRHLNQAESLIVEGKPLTDNLRAIILQRFDEFADHRQTLELLKRFGFDRTHVLSPFHSSHREIRKASVDLFVRLIDRSKLSWPSNSKRELDQGLWLFHLLMLFYWIGDSSPEQKQTHTLLARSLTHLTTALRLLKLPGAQGLSRSILNTLKSAHLLEDL